MRAVQFTQWQTFPTIEGVERPQPGPGEILLMVAGSKTPHPCRFLCFLAVRVAVWSGSLRVRLRSGFLIIAFVSISLTRRKALGASQ